MLTHFGKILRKLRIDHDGETLVEMASKLNVTASFLSYVETGKRSIPETWLNEIPRLYNLNEQQRQELLSAGLVSINTVRLDIEGRSEEDKSLALAFARRLSQLTVEEKESLHKILTEEQK